MPPFYYSHEKGNSDAISVHSYNEQQTTIDIQNKQLADKDAELEQEKAENARLRALLENK